MVWTTEILNLLYIMIKIYDSWTFLWTRSKTVQNLKFNELKFTFTARNNVVDNLELDVINNLVLYGSGFYLLFYLPLSRCQQNPTRLWTKQTKPFLFDQSVCRRRAMRHLVVYDCNLFIFLPVATVTQLSTLFSVKMFPTSNLSPHEMAHDYWKKVKSDTMWVVIVNAPPAHCCIFIGTCTVYGILTQWLNSL